MRKTYISPEYQHKRVYGTYNMKEESNFFGAKMLDIEDLISIDRQDVSYFQNTNGEQLNFGVESTTTAQNYSSILDKQNNHKLEIDETQPLILREKNTKWVMTIEMGKILENYLFAVLKRWRTFEGIKNDMTLGGDVNVALRTYIKENVINRYTIDSIDFYIEHQDLRMQNLLKWKNDWNYKIVRPENRYNKIQRETSLDGSVVKLYFTQEKPADSFNYDYFFTPVFRKL